MYFNSPPKYLMALMYYCMVHEHWRFRVFMQNDTILQCVHRFVLYFHKHIRIDVCLPTLSLWTFQVLILSKNKQEYTEMLHHNFMQCVCTGHTDIGHSLLIYIMNSCYYQDSNSSFMCLSPLEYLNSSILLMLKVNTVRVKFSQMAINS